jgi:hypothetical protein
MLTKMKLAIVLCASMLGGVASAQGMGPRHGKAAHVMKEKRLAKFDANKDGRLDETERAVARATRIAKLFEKLDADRNGSISLAELQSAKKLGKGMRGKHHRMGKAKGKHRRAL